MECQEEYPYYRLSLESESERFSEYYQSVHETELVVEH